MNHKIELSVKNDPNNVNEVQLLTGSADIPVFVENFKKTGQAFPLRITVNLNGDSLAPHFPSFLNLIGSIEIIEIALTNCHILGEDFEKFLSLLSTAQTVSSLKILRLSGGTDIIPLLDILSFYLNKLKLEVLEISRQSFQTNLDVSFRALYKLADTISQNTTIETLLIKENLFGDDILKSLVPLHNNQFIKNLDLSYNNINNFLPLSDVLSPSLQAINLDYNNLGSNKTHPIPEYETEELISLSLRHNQLTSDHVQDLLLWLSSTKIKRLCLGDNPFLIKDASFKNLIEKFDTLQELDLSYTAISESDAKLLSQTFPWSTLKSLKLNNCRMSWKAIETFLDSALQSSTLVKLDLSHNFFLQRKANNTSKSTEVSAQVDMNNKNCNNVLRELNLANCKIGPTIISRLLSKIKSKELERIDFSGASLVASDIIALRCFLESNPNVKLVVLENIDAKCLQSLKHLLLFSENVEIKISPSLVEKMTNELGQNILILSQKFRALYLAYNLALLLMCGLDATDLPELPVDIRKAILYYLPSIQALNLAELKAVLNAVEKRKGTNSTKNTQLSFEECQKQSLANSFSSSTPNMQFRNPDDNSAYSQDQGGSFSSSTPDIRRESHLARPNYRAKFQFFREVVQAGVLVELTDGIKDHLAGAAPF